MRNRIFTATAMAAALALVGCADSGSSAPEENTETPEAEVGLSQETIDTFLAAGAGTAGAAGAETVKIGWVNADSGPGSTPELTRQLEAAVELVNTELGGAQGKTIELEKCEVTSEETGLSCGQQFANDAEIVAVMQGSIASGSESFHSVVDGSGIPIVGALPLTAADGGAANGFYTAPGSFSTVPAVLEMVGKHLKPETVAVLSVEGEPISTQIAAGLAGALSATGVAVKQAAISLSATDITAPLVAAGVQDADLIVPLVILPPQCIAVDTALETLGADIEVLALSSCYSQAVKAELGDYPAWNYFSAWPNTNVDYPDDPELQAEVDAYNEWHATIADREMDAVIPLQTALAMQRHLNTAAELTPAAVAEAAASWQGPVYLGSPVVAYGSVVQPMPLPALPSLAMRAFAYEGDGAWSDVTGGAWLGLNR